MVNLKEKRIVWAYKGINIYPSPMNSSGIRWNASMPGVGNIRADTKQSMRQLINYYLSE